MLLRIRSAQKLPQQRLCVSVSHSKNRFKRFYKIFNKLVQLNKFIFSITIVSHIKQYFLTFVLTSHVVKLSNNVDGNDQKIYDCLNFFHSDSTGLHFCWQIDV